MKYIMMICCLNLLLANAKAQKPEDAICGKWMYEEKNLAVEVYKQDTGFKARIIWFHDPKDTLPITEKTDSKNPDKWLRTRKIIGMDVLSGLLYDPKEKRWVHGKIYDSTSGKTWDATVWLSDAQTLQVRGYYIFKFLGKTMTFTRMQ